MESPIPSCKSTVKVYLLLFSCKRETFWFNKHCTPPRIKMKVEVEKSIFGNELGIRCKRVSYSSFVFARYNFSPSK